MAFWHHEKYKLKNLKYTLTQAGLSANLTLNMDESRTILDEDLTQAHEMSVDLILVDDQVKISSWMGVALCRGQNVDVQEKMRVKRQDGLSRN